MPAPTAAPTGPATTAPATAPVVAPIAVAFCVPVNGFAAGPVAEGSDFVSPVA